MGLNLSSTGLSGADYIETNGVKTYYKTIYLSNPTAYTFDIDVKTVNGSGAIYEIFAGYTHYGTGYGAVLKQIVAHRSNSQSDLLVVDTITNQTSTNGGSWAASYVDGDTIRLTKTAGAGGGVGYGYILIRGHA